MTFGDSAGIVGDVTEDKARPLGEWLRQRREELEISLEQAEADTRIRIQYLRALEAEEFDALPDQVVGRGFLRNYAAYLDLDPKEAAERYAEVVAPPEPESVAAAESSPFDAGPFRPVPLHEIQQRRSRRWMLAALAVILVAALSLLAWWGYPYVSNWLAPEESSTPEPTSTQRVVKLPTATHTATATIVIVETAEAETAVPTETTATLEPTWTPTLTPRPSPTSSPPVYTGIFLELVFTDTSWIQVTVDGVRDFQGELETGTYRSWYGEERIELRVGNAGAVLLTVNGQNLGTLGGSGDVVDRVFEKVGEGISEATITPQPQITVTEEVAASPTAEPTAPATSTVAPPTSQISPTPTVSPTLALPTPEISPTVPVTPTTSP